MSLGANRGGHLRDVVVRRADDQHRARLAVRVQVGLRLPPRLGHRPRPIRPRHLPDRAHLFELFKPARGMLPQGFDRLPVRLRGLTLDLRERDTPQPGLAFEDPERIAGLDALELSGIAAEHHPGRLLLRELQQRRHLSGRDHPRFVHDQDPVAQVRLLLGIDEETLNRHRLAKTRPAAAR